MDRTTARALFSLVVGLTALPLGAQAKPKAETAAPQIPASAFPPEGMCRVWLAKVPVREQPAPTDCATAIRNRPRDAKVLFGDLRNKAAQPATTANATRQEARFRGLDNTAPPVARGAATSGPRATTVNASVVSARSTQDSGKPVKPEKPQ